MAETEKRNARKVVTGTVVSISGDKSITVKIDYVTVMETRPLSKTKRWRLVEIVERAK